MPVAPGRRRSRHWPGGPTVLARSGSPGRYLRGVGECRVDGHGVAGDGEAAASPGNVDADHLAVQVYQRAADLRRGRGLQDHAISPVLLTPPAVAVAFIVARVPTSMVRASCVPLVPTAVSTTSPGT